MDGMKAARLPRDRPHRTRAPQERVRRQIHRSREPDYPRKSNLPGILEIVCSALDPCLRQTASFSPSANRGGIITRESVQTERFHTVWALRAIAAGLKERSIPAARGASGLLFGWRDSWRRLPSLSAEASPPRERQSGHAGASCEKSEIGVRHLLVGTVARPSGRLSRRWSNPRPPGCFLRPPNRVPACPCPCPKKRISVMAITQSASLSRLG
jgi:hypothetical protein